MTPHTKEVRPAMTDPDRDMTLDQFLDDLRVRKAAAHLGCSPVTVQKLRKELAATA